MPSASTGASDSMPSTAMPSASCSSTSASPGCSASSASARARTSAVSGSSRVGGAQTPCGRDLEAALVSHPEPADLLDSVAPQLDPQRVVLGGGKDVEDAAPHGELAALLDQVGAGVPSFDQPLDGLRQVDLVAHAQPHRFEVAEPDHDGLEQRPHRRDDH